MTTLTREQWEEPGYEIGAHTSSPMVNPDELLYTVNHYPAANVIGADPVAWFRGVQRDYVNGRGYSIGYSWGYWPDGLEVECRGWDYRNAANDVPDRPENENRVSVSLLLVVPGLGDQGQPATEAQQKAVRERLVDVHARAGRTLPNIVHGDLEPTQCAGAGVNRQTHTGLFLPVAPDPIPPTDPEEVDVPLLLKVTNGNGAYAVFTQTPAGILRWVVDGREHAGWVEAGAVEVDLPADAFVSTVDYGRTIGGISPDVTRITGITPDHWAGRLIA